MHEISKILSLVDIMAIMLTSLCCSWLIRHGILKQGFSKSAFKGPILNFQQCQRSGPEQLVINKTIFLLFNYEMEAGPD